MSADAATEQDRLTLRRALDLAAARCARRRQPEPAGRRDRSCATASRSARAITRDSATFTPSGRRSRIAAAAATDPAGATMYVTLEPCGHSGRQPPCAEAILEAGLARVVYASDDPSEKASGRGPGMLRDGGVEVEQAAGERGGGRAAAQPAVPQARPHRTAARDAEDGHLAGRLRRHRRAAIRNGSPANRAASWSTAGAPTPTPLRLGSAPLSPTTRCSPHATSTSFASQPAWSSTPRRGCRSTRSSSVPSTRRRWWS